MNKGNIDFEKEAADCSYGFPVGEGFDTHDRENMVAQMIVWARSVAERAWDQGFRESEWFFTECEESDEPLPTNPYRLEQTGSEAGSTNSNSD